MGLMLPTRLRVTTMSKPKTTADAIIGSVLSVTKSWAKQRKAEERHANAQANRIYRLSRVREDTIKDVACAVMEEAYRKASANGTLPAHARQIMYQARPLIQAKTDKPLDDQYFCQQLLPNYMQERNVNWNVVYDDRGHFIEPHTETTIGLGTLSVRNYSNGIHPPRLVAAELKPAQVSTHGPAGSFGAVLFIEKEGFMPLFEESKLAERFDLAIMSTKGLSNTAARSLIDRICGGRGIPLFVLHDFDKSGFSILGTLQRETRRFSFKHQHKVIDLGLRLTDVEELGLESEEAFDRGNEWSRRQNLRENGASPEEIEFLLDNRVELNALASDELIQLIERKLKRHGVKKIIPDKKQLAKAYRLFVRGQRIAEIIEKALEDVDNSDITVPDDLARRVEKYLMQNGAERWDAAVASIAAGNDDGLDDGDMSRTLFTKADVESALKGAKEVEAKLCRYEADAEIHFERPAVTREHRRSRRS
jgi:hypothetical protein